MDVNEFEELKEAAQRNILVDEPARWSDEFTQDIRDCISRLHGLNGSLSSLAKRLGCCSHPSAADKRDDPGKPDGFKNNATHLIGELRIQICTAQALADGICEDF